MVFRELFAVGLTAFDRIEKSVLGVKPSPTNLVARLEVRDLVEQIGLLPKQAAPAKSGEAPAGDGVSGELAVDGAVSVKPARRRRAAALA
jgi:hypothetical protein